MTSEPFGHDRKCMGWHCDLRDKCARYGLPAVSTMGFFQPQYHSENCDHYQPRRNWRDEDEND